MSFVYDNDDPKTDKITIEREEGRLTVWVNEEIHFMLDDDGTMSMYNLDEIKGVEGRWKK